MKYLIALSFLFSLSAFANNEKLSCRTVDGAVEFTREELVVRSTNKQALVTDLETFISVDGNSDPVEGDMLEFKSRFDGQPSYKLKVTKVGKSKKVAGQENSCGVGFETNRFALKADMEQGDLHGVLTFSCYHFLGYHGHNCQ